MHEPLVVGPRELDNEWVEVWLDTGAGPGFVTRVPHGNVDQERERIEVTLAPLRAVTDGGDGG